MTTLVIDTNDLYYNLKRKYSIKFKLDYSKYMEYITGMYRIDEAHAFGLNIRKTGDGFIKSLQSAGFTTHMVDVKSINSHTQSEGIVPLVYHLAKLQPKSRLILGSSATSLEPVIDNLMGEMNIDVTMVASGFSKWWRTRYNTLEIPKFLGVEND